MSYVGSCEWVRMILVLALWNSCCSWLIRWNVSGSPCVRLTWMRSVFAVVSCGLYGLLVEMMTV